MGPCWDRVKALGPAAVRPLIAMATDESLHNVGQDSSEVWAPLHAIQMLGERVLELAPDSKMSRQDRAEYAQFAREELAELDGPAGKLRRTELAVATGPDRRGSAGRPSGPQQPVRHAGKLGRNDPCPCGSGKKYKKCCGR